MSTYYRRNLPHYQPPGAIYHIVFRLAGSLPHAVILKLQDERLRQERRIAGLLDMKKYSLLAFCIMPNHVHVVVERSVAPLYRTLQSLKNRTSRKANMILRRSRKFWQAESYDHVIRCGEELDRTLWYVLNNPVKAQLVELWERWPWTYCTAGCQSTVQHHGGSNIVERSVAPFTPT